MQEKRNRSGSSANKTSIGLIAWRFCGQRTAISLLAIPLAHTLDHKWAWWRKSYAPELTNNTPSNCGICPWKPHAGEHWCISERHDTERWGRFWQWALSWQYLQTYWHRVRERASPIQGNGIAVDPWLWDQRKDLCQASINCEWGL